MRPKRRTQLCTQAREVDVAYATALGASVLQAKHFVLEVLLQHVEGHRA